MAKYNEEIVDRICSLIRADSFTVSEICLQVGITESTYHAWKDTKSEFSESIKKAENEFLSMLAVEAKKSLLKKVKGYDAEETKTTLVFSGECDDQGKRKYLVKEKVVTSKHIPPSDAMVIFTLSNRDGENWKNKQYTENSGEIKLSSKFEDMTEQQLEDFINGESKPKKTNRKSGGTKRTPTKKGSK